MSTELIDGAPESIYGWGALPAEAVPPVLLYGDGRLREPSVAVKPDAFSSDEHSMLRQGLQLLAAALHRHRGAAIAAPQVGVLQRVIVIHEDTAPDISNGYPFALINPLIIDQSNEETIEGEGCLSFPGVTVRVARPQWVVVQALTPDGALFTVKGCEWLARALCHEIEHLDGKLLIDHTRGLRKQMIAAKINKFRKHLQRKDQTAKRRRW